MRPWCIELRQAGKWMFVLILFQFQVAFQKVKKEFSDWSLTCQTHMNIWSCKIQKVWTLELLFFEKVYFFCTKAAPWMDTALWAWWKLLTTVHAQGFATPQVCKWKYHHFLEKRNWNSRFIEVFLKKILLRWCGELSSPFAVLVKFCNYQANSCLKMHKNQLKKQREPSRRLYSLCTNVNDTLWSLAVDDIYLQFVICDIFTALH